MKLLSKIRGTVRKCDFFSSTALLRYKEEPEYQSLTGGFCSLVTIFVFVIIFTQTILNTVERVNINSTRTLVEDVSPSLFSTGNSPFLFTIGITNINLLNTTIRYFDIGLTQRVSYANGTFLKTNIPLVPCQKSDWIAVNPDFSTIFDKLGMSQWLCPQNGSVFDFQGKFTSDIFRYLKLTVTKCNPLLPGAPCATTTDINNFLAVNSYFTFDYYFINSLLNENEQDYLSYYLQDRNFFQFTPTSGTSANIFFSSYEIITDNSLTPLSDMSTTTGGIVYESPQTFTFQPTTTYVQLYLRKSSVSLSITRSFQRIDQTFSYIGGLFSTILALMFLINLYNQYAYQVQIGSRLYSIDDEKKIDSSDLNFMNFFGLLLYGILDKFGCQPNWPTTRIFFEAKEETAKQLDIVLILRKIIYLQKAVGLLFGDHQINGLHLQPKMTLNDSVKIREKYRLLKRSKRWLKEAAPSEANQTLSGLVQPRKPPDNPIIGQLNLSQVGYSLESAFHKYFPESSQSQEQLQKKEKEGILLQVQESVNKLKLSIKGESQHNKSIYPLLENDLKCIFGGQDDAPYINAETITVKPAKNKHHHHIELEPLNLRPKTETQQ